MNQRLASALAFSATVALATLASAIMAGNAMAEGPLVDSTPFVSSRTRADVRAELMRDRNMVTSAANEWTSQLNEPHQVASGYTREQARAEFIASREEVRAATAEHGGSGYFAYTPMRMPATLLAREASR